MKLVRLCIIIAIVAVLPLALQVKSARAAATAEGVALNAFAGCNNADLDISLTTVGATRELG